MSQPRWPGYDRRAELAWVEAQRGPMLPDMVRREKRALGERLTATRSLFRRSLLVGDVHSHTTFSDGVSSVAENKAIADLVGLDFLFITDHRTQRHRPHCRKAGVWWGQEPPSCGREIGVLMPRKLFVPRHDSLAADFARARRTAPFAWIPHPAGYGASTRYPAEMAAQLRTLPDRFAMEVLNGSLKLSRAYNAISAEAVALWDELLGEGKQVTVLGGSDAHICFTIGTAWTGVYGARCRSADVVRELGAGHSFASEGPLLWISCGRAIMGDTVRRRRGMKARIRFVAADAAGLHSVRIVTPAGVRRCVRGRDASRISGDIAIAVGSQPSYVRLECTASDGRRAFASPLFLQPS